MDEKLAEAKKIVEKHNQNHLEKAYQRLNSNEEKQKFLDSILTINFNQVEKLFEQTKESNNPGANDKIEPIEYVDKNKMADETKEKYKELGEKAIKESKLAVVTMAGGQRY